MGHVLLIIGLADLVFVCFKIIRVARRRAMPTDHGALEIEDWRRYAGRLIRAAAVPGMVLLVAVAAYLAVLYFGPIRPVYQWGS